MHESRKPSSSSHSSPRNPLPAQPSKLSQTGFHRSKAPSVTILPAIIKFYVEGFSRMTLGKTLWAIILIKLFIMFAIVRTVLLPSHLNTHCDTPEQKSAYVIDKLLSRAGSTPPAADPKTPANPDN